MLREVGGDGSPTKSKPWWRQVATLVGVAGLAATLVFNTLAVRTSAQQNRQTRETAQIGLLTTLNSNASDSEREINETQAVDHLCDTTPAPLDDADSAALLAGLDYYSYLSWLFNHDRLTVAGSRDFFGERLIYGWRLGRHFFGADEMRLRYKELNRFVRDTPQAKRGDNPC
jgi:hypothetical protein